MNYIELKNVNLKFKDQVIFEEANLEISKPGLYCLIGRNGCGKTTLFNILTKKIKLDSGYVSVNNEEISYCDANSYLFTNLTVRENLLLITDNLDNILNMLEKFNVSKLIDSSPESLSEGERQRIAIIRTILEDKPIMLLDEVTSHIDDDASDIVLNYLKELSKNHIIIYVTHYKTEVKRFADYIIKIQENKFLVETQNIIDNDLKEYIKLEYKPTKILNKIIRFIPDYIFSFLFAVLISITLLVVWLTSLTPNQAMLDVESKSLNPQYSVIDDYCMNIFDSTKDKESKPDLDGRVEKFVENNPNFQLGFMWYNLTSCKDETEENYTAIIHYFLFDNNLSDYEILCPSQTYDKLEYYNFATNNVLKFRNVEADIKILEGTYYFDFLVANEYTFKQIDKFNNKMINTTSETQVHLVSGRMPENDDEMVVSTKSACLEETTFTYTYANVKKTFDIVGVYDYVTSSIYEVEPYYIVQDTAFDFKLEADVLQTRYIDFIAYGDSRYLTSDDLNYIKDANLYIINDVMEESFNAYNNFKNLKDDFIRLLIFALVFDALTVAFYISYWFNANKDRYIELKILNRISLIKKRCVTKKVILNIVIFTMGLILYFIARNIINDSLLQECFSLSTIEQHQFTFIHNNLLFFMLPLVIIIQSMITTIQLRRTLYDRI